MKFIKKNDLLTKESLVEIYEEDIPIGMIHIQGSAIILTAGGNGYNEVHLEINLDRIISRSKEPEERKKWAEYLKG